MHDTVLFQKIAAALQHQRCSSSGSIQIIIQFGSEDGVLDEYLLVFSQVDQDAVLVVSFQRTASLVELTVALIRIVSIDDRTQKVAQLVSFVAHHLGAVRRGVDRSALLTAKRTVARIGQSLRTRLMVCESSRTVQRLVRRVERQIVQVAVVEQIHTDAGRWLAGG